MTNKDDLVDGLVDLVFGEIDVPSDAADWKTAMRRRAVSAREVLSRHRWAIGLMDGPSPPRAKPTRRPALIPRDDEVVRGDDDWLPRDA